jgi:hypothetical protein
MITHVITLSHIPVCSNRYGSLDEFSTFVFESHLGQLKKYIKPTRYVFKHVFNRLMQIRSLFNSPRESGITITTKMPNNCAIIRGEPAIITNIADDQVEGIRMQFQGNIYEKPYPSKALGIGYYAKSLKRVREHVSNIKEKCFLFPARLETPSNNHYVVVPFGVA